MANSQAIFKRSKKVTEEMMTAKYAISESPPPLVPLERHLTAFKLSHVLSWTLCLAQIALLLFLAVKFHLKGGTAPWPLYVAIWCECALTFPDAVVAINIFFALFVFEGSTARGRKPHPLRSLDGPDGPTVDVMITCCREPVEIIINTVTAAALQDYPSRQLRVFVLDDGNDPNLRHELDKLQHRLQRKIEEGKSGDVIYVCRRLEGESHHQTHFKSGNLRFGIKVSEERRKDGQVSQFLAGLDADMTPESDWLKSTIPHLLVNEKVAMACIPQVFPQKFSRSPFP